MKLKFWTVSLVGALVSCGPLPSEKKSNISAPQVGTSSNSGLVLTLSENRTSSSLSYYDLRSGNVVPLMGGESGDVFTVWLKDRLFVFNRSAGRVSFSSLIPKLGVSSRSTETATPGIGAFDPVAAAIDNRDQILLAHNSAGSVVVTDLAGAAVKATLKDVKTRRGDVKFHPQDIVVRGDTAWISHQSLDANFTAIGGGSVFSARQTTEAWEFTQSQGIDLTISNPVYMKARGDSELILGGVCYDVSPSSTCRAGIDLLNMATGSVTHISEWDKREWSANGSFYQDLTDDTLLACVTSNSLGNVLARYTLATGSLDVIRKIDGPGCGGVVVDRYAGIVWLGEQLKGSRGRLVQLNELNAVLGQVEFSYPVSGLTATYDP